MVETFSTFDEYMESYLSSSEQYLHLASGKRLIQKRILPKKKLIQMRIFSYVGEDRTGHITYLCFVI